MEQQLKQRLTGAIVIVSLAVIFIPVILEGPRDEWTPRDYTIPEPPELDYNTPPALPLPAPAVPAPVAEAADEPVSEALPAAVPAPPPVAEPAQAPAEDKPPPGPAVDAAISTPAEPAPATAASSLARGWYVQVGSFSQQANARGERDRLRKAGLAAHLQASDHDQDAVYRVLIGPEKSRELAEQLKEQVAGTQKLQGIVIEIGAAAGG